MRTILDNMEPADIKPSFTDIFRKLQRGKVLEPMVFMNNCYLLSIDGTGYFSSNEIHCDSCCTKTNSKTGKITYQHQMLGAVIVHPDVREVIPLAPEPIIKQDGKKNLSVVFAMLMMLAFLVDQTQQLTCRLFQAVWGKLGSKRSLWEQMRALFFGYRFDSMEEIFKALFYGFKREHLVILEDLPPS